MSNLIPHVQIPPQSHSSLSTFETCPRQYNHYTLKLGSEVMDEMSRLVAEIEGEQEKK